jgi:perosamine synthetase
MVMSESRTHEFIAVNEPVIGSKEMEYVTECLESGWVSSEGPFVERFERAFAEMVGRRFGIAVCNGTAALDASIAALDIGVGDEIIMPTLTIISSIGQAVRSGAKPLLVDCDPATWNMDVQQIRARVEESIKRSNRLKAIMIVHLYGLPADIDPLLDIAATYGLAVIEDSAEMIGQTYKGHPCGSFGDMSTFSFYPNKHITTGEGGMIATNSDGLSLRCQSLRNLCFGKERRFVHEELGWNMRMSNLQAALGLAQLERLQDSVNRKRQIGETYHRFLAGIPGLQLPLQRTDYAENIYWVFGVVLDDEVPFDAEEAMRRLAVRGIGTRPFFWPMHEQPVLRRLGLFHNESYPVAERLARRGFYLPSGLALSDQQIQTVAEAVWELMRY